MFDVFTPGSAGVPPADVGQRFQPVSTQSWLFDIQSFRLLETLAELPPQRPDKPS
jgi:hypothetical protein